jgi:type VI secretion system secreted protein Hcp
MAVDMFLKLDNITGESQDAAHPNAIELLAWSWGMTQSGTMHMGTGGGSGKVNVQDISITKYIDSATHALMDACCNGKHFDQATIIVRKAGEKPLEYLKITLKQVLVSSVSTGGSGGEERLTENISLNFAQFKTEYFPQNAKGASAGGPKTAEYNIAKNAKS